ncbi:hypothetical protein Hanom_Chr11g01059781 [Helianthus anomalus]
MSIPSISTFISKYSNPITLQILSHETLCSDSIICQLLKSKKFWQRLTQSIEVCGRLRVQGYMVFNRTFTTAEGRPCSCIYNVDVYVNDDGPYKS